MTNLYRDIPTFDDFAKVLDGTVYHALPDDWWVGTSDIVGSTKAVEAGRFKDVNMVGASVICAVSNALGHSDYPFLFGGDGASFACPPDKIDAVRNAMATTATWAAETLDLELRVGLVQIADIRSADRDVRVARYAVSDPVSYAMFAGGGMQWAEDQMKHGQNLIAPAPSGHRPDLTGFLSHASLTGSGPTPRGTWPQRLGMLVASCTRLRPPQVRLHSSMDRATAF